MKHARTSPHLTLGVAAFSLAQAEAILDEVEKLREQDPTAEGFFSQHEFEPFFVKNLESVQGDERDVIFISVGYGKDEAGYVSMNFGALNGSGGERRLNVLITRARQACEVFSNLTESDIDLARTPARGLAALKAFLKFAATGILDVPGVVEGDHESPFEEEVAHALTQAGHQVRSQVGSGGFRVDLAVVDPSQPGRYLLGIECDGASYHSSRSARDRDRLRQQVLESLGWRIHRIWSTDWFKNGDGELRRVLQAIEQAKTWSTHAPVPPTETNSPDRQRAPEPQVVRSNSPPPAADMVVTAEPYVIADISVRLGNLQLHEVSRSKLGEHVHAIAQVEGPVHVQQVMRRICDAAGVGRLGSRIESAISAGVDYARQQGWVKVRGEFLWPPEDGKVAIRDRSNLEAAERKIELIAPEEVKAAIAAIVEGSFGIDEEEVAPAVARLLGFARTSEEIAAGIRKHLKAMIRKSDVESNDGHITLPRS
jgi:very-short-patch-repair endonuclease